MRQTMRLLDLFFFFFLHRFEYCLFLPLSFLSGSSAVYVANDALFFFFAAPPYLTSAGLCFAIEKRSTEAVSFCCCLCACVFFFFFEFSCVRITRRCCCCCCFCLTLFNSHRRTTQSLISALKYTKTANKRREKEKKKKKKLA